MCPRFTSLFLGVALTLGLAAPPTMAGAVDIEDTSWSLVTNVKLSARPLGKLNEVRELDLDVYSFDFEMPETGLTGIQEEQGKGLRLFFDEFELLEFLADELQGLADASPHDVTVGEVTLVKAKGMLVPRPRGTELSLALRASVVAQVELVIDGEDVTSKVALNLNGSDTQDYDLVDTDWEAEVKSSASIAGVGKFGELGDFELSFSETELDLYETLGGVLLGDWYVDADGDLQAAFDETELEEYVLEIVDEVAGEYYALLDVDELILDSTKIQFRVKAGVSIKFVVSFKFTVVGQLEGEQVQAKGRFSSKGVALLD